MKKKIYCLVIMLSLSSVSPLLASASIDEEVIPEISLYANFSFIFDNIPPKKYKYKNITYTLVDYIKSNGKYIGTYYR